MDFICSTEELKIAVIKTAKVINKTTVLPILERILIQTEDTNLKLRGTDLGSTNDTIIEANVREHGATTIVAKTLLEILNTVSNEDIRIISNDDEQELIIKAGKTEFKILNSLQADSYPDIDTVDRKNYITIDRELFVKGIDLTEFSTSDDDISKQFLTGINVQTTEDNMLKFVSTDSHRLSVFKCPIISKTMDINVIIPSQSAKIMAELASVPGEPINLYITRNTISTSVDSSDYYGRLIESNYPDVTRVIPTEFNTELEVNRHEFLGALNRMTVAAKENAFRATLSLEDNKLVLGAETKEHNITVTEEIDVVINGGSFNKMGINVKYILEALKVMNTDIVEIKVVSNDKAFMIKMKDDENFIHIVMPARI